MDALWSRHGRWGRWAALLGTLAAIVVLVAAAQRWSPALPGAAAQVYLNNVEREYAPSAYFYTEVTGVAEFVGEDGRYGRLARPARGTPPDGPR